MMAFNFFLQIQIYLFTIGLVVTSCSNKNPLIKEEYDTNKMLVKKYSINKNGDKNGFYKEYYPSGALKYDFNYTDDFYNGEQKIFFENGNLQSKSFYKASVIDSLQFWYYPDGKIKSEYFWLDGRQFGVQKLYSARGYVEEIYFASSLCDSCMIADIHLDSIGQIINKKGQLVSCITGSSKIGVGDTLKAIFYGLIPENYKSVSKLVDIKNNVRNERPVFLSNINNNKGYLLLMSFEKPGSYKVGLHLELTNEKYKSRIEDSCFISVDVY